MDYDPTGEVCRLIQKTVREGLLFDYITNSTAEYLQKYRVPIFYTLPKIHKPGFPPPGRPIVSGTNSIFEPLSKYIDSFLQPFVGILPTYIKDTIDFITKIEGLPAPGGMALVTLDVNSLYTNIPHEEARMCLQRTLEKRTIPFPPTYFLLDLVDIIFDEFLSIFSFRLKG